MHKNIYFLKEQELSKSFNGNNYNLLMGTFAFFLISVRVGCK